MIEVHKKQSDERNLDGGDQQTNGRVGPMDPGLHPRNIGDGYREKGAKNQHTAYLEVGTDCFGQVQRGTVGVVTVLVDRSIG